jgi:hypothetical protein
MDELSQITDKILDIVTNSPDHTVLGVRLGSALKKNFQAFAPAVYQCRNLRMFVNKYVPAIVEKEYNGVDVVYTLATGDALNLKDDIEVAVGAATERPAPFISLPADTLTWKAYSNPAYPFKVLANPETGDLRAVPERDAPQDPWLAIPKLAATVHHEIASEFVASLTNPTAKATLSALLSDPQWYVTFFGTAKRLGLSQHYGAFKRERLIKHFNEALKEHGIPAATGTPKANISPYRSVSVKKGPRLSDDSQLRELVSRLAFSLPIDELRSIRMPIGVVLDAFRQ